ncbi:MAG: excinuclease ABC subunit UvrA [Bdellovibrionota bacterium]
MGKKHLPLQIRSASENNLKEVSLDIEHDLLTVVTGLSGSGKSSLAFSTVYAEGQRRYIETFSPYTRQFLDRLKKPNVLSVENVRPAIAIQQKTRIMSSRSTVGSITNINDLLKILWTNLSEPCCPHTGKNLIAYSPLETFSLLKEWESAVPSDKEVIITSPILLPNSKKQRAAELSRLSLLGYSRYFNETSNCLEKLERISEDALHGDQLLIAISRHKTGKIRDAELKENLTQAYELSRGKARLIFPTSTDEELSQFPRRDGNTVQFSEDYELPDRDAEPLPFQIPKRRAALFDPNSNIGACPTCTGFGYQLLIDDKKVIPNDGLSIHEGAIHPWKVSSDGSLERKLLRFCEEKEISTTTPWHQLPSTHKDMVLHHKDKTYVGVYPWFSRLERKKHRMHIRVLLSRYRSQILCQECGGGRLKREAQLFRLCGRSLPDIWNTPIKELSAWIQEVEALFNRKGSYSRDLHEVLTRLRGRIRYLDDLGLSYLTLGRPSRTLSGGETQRVNLTTALGSELVSTHFVLDEPSVGLHPRDTDRLMESVRALQQKGNSLLIVEHDTDCIDNADRIIELGPYAGAEGGEVTFNGPREDWKGITRRQELPTQRKIPTDWKNTLALHNLHARNLKDISVEFPIGYFTTITGVSGSGKSTLITEGLLAAWTMFEQRGSVDNAVGFEHFSQVLLIDQTGLTKSPRANIATYSGVWDTFRTALAASPEAERRSLTRSSFSFNVEGGRCPVCKGAGHLKEDMQFLSDVYIQCEECLGQRFQPKVLEVRFHERNVAEWLNCTIATLPDIFPEQKSITTTVELLNRLGLGHLRLGHPLSDLSGGEAQRLKLIPFLQKANTSNALLIFDEPTTGLHLHDVRRLIELFRDLTTYGHTVICIEHNQELILGSDFLIDLGPEAGIDGGEVVCTGTPASFLKNPSPRSHTATCLQKYVQAATKRVQGTEHNTTQQPSKSSDIQSLSIRGAREHNLKNIDVDIPHNAIVAITGVSGSGKSTLAKDIIYAEGQRRYLDCLSPYARQFIRELSKPDIDEITNIRPTICVYQHTFQPGMRSTIGTMSEVYNFLRLLYSKAGEQYCPDHPTQRVEALSAETITEIICAKGDANVKVLAPVIKGKKGAHRDIFRRALKSEIFEVRVDGQFHETGRLASEGLARQKQHDIDYVWANINPYRVPHEFITDAIEEVFAISGGTIIVYTEESEEVFSRERACPTCQQGFFRPDPEDLSFHSRRGRCDTCDGTGTTKQHTCSACHGSRLKHFGQHVRIHGKSIADLCRLIPSEIRTFLEECTYEERLRDVVTPIHQEIFTRLEVLNRIGLDYLPLERSCEALSSGELQRLRLAAALGTPLNGALYIFDEPSAGLHPEDNERVLDEFRRLKDRENTILLIEHDESLIQCADHIIEVGPEGGRKGGEITFQGPRERFVYPTSTLSTVTYDDIDKGTRSEEVEHKGEMKLTISNINNISALDVSIPLHQLVTIIGVSGAGKSTLIHEGLLPLAMEACENGLLDFNTDNASLTLSEEFERVLVVDQTPIGKNARSTPASYLKVFDEIRKLFATTIEAKSRGWTASFFSYNSGDGRCPECKGLGRIQLEMTFLSEAYISCEHCRGRRYGDDALSIRYQGRSIADVLEMTFDEAKEAFAAHRKIHRIIHTACELGLGYLSLGQSSSTLSGGESQRMKLVNELARPQRGHTLYVLDEPTVGLHRKDVHRLLTFLNSLVRQGNSVVLIEHDHDVIRRAEHLIELGPGPGERGGRIIFEGTPDDLLQTDDTPWGRHFKVLTQHQVSTGEYPPSPAP